MKSREFIHILFSLLNPLIINKKIECENCLSVILTKFSPFFSHHSHPILTLDEQLFSIFVELTDGYLEEINSVFNKL